ncbi:hypothetical protein FQB35_12210 [Crassaminicella thermophila]|uniref:Uncharacterized protein n=1 Tax=Crassaminicella thermophila TaxID=2599308 RepID=A0A5C0SF97_CRATE|nr:hypothetical protein [Crassaminicella thermophila]QEK13021.1 hypothetical protein FQB35_12210 [Crassaminicella thermophila]
MKNILITIGITIIFCIIFTLYAFDILFTMINTNGSILIIGVVFIIFTGFILALIYNMYKRIKEIKEEEKDDFSKY